MRLVVCIMSLQEHFIVANPLFAIKHDIIMQSQSLSIYLVHLFFNLK